MPHQHHRRRAVFHVPRPKTSFSFPAPSSFHHERTQERGCTAASPAGQTQQTTSPRGDLDGGTPRRTRVLGFLPRDRLARAMQRVRRHPRGQKGIPSSALHRSRSHFGGERHSRGEAPDAQDPLTQLRGSWTVHDQLGQFRQMGHPASLDGRRCTPAVVLAQRDHGAKSPSPHRRRSLAPAGDRPDANRKSQSRETENKGIEESCQVGRRTEGRHRRQAGSQFHQKGSGRV